MCGISGILSYKNKVEINQLKNMTDELIHRGPDGEGQWINKEANIGLGHRRLSIIDLSDAGAQPMQYASSRYSVTFNGELYNYIELKQELISKGYQFKTETDTEVLLALYDAEKENCLNKIDGMFAFAIWDEKEQALFCARDRFGEKPFFYFQDKDKFVFASEIKALWKIGINKQIKNNFVYNYLLFGTIEDINRSNETIYKDIFKLEPATFIKIDLNGKIFKKKYWDIDFSNINNSIKIDEAKEEFLSLFTNSIKNRLRSDVPVGSSLSGGLDSSSIVCIIDKIKGNKQEQKTFSARFKNFEKDEGYFIKKVLENRKNIKSFDVYPDEKSLIENWQKIVHHQDEPFGSFSIAAQYEVMQLAKQNGVTVLLDGQGADELMAGYHTYFDTYYSYLQKHNKKLFNSDLIAYKKLFGKDYSNITLKDKIRQKNEKIYSLISKQRRKILSVKAEYFVGINSEIVKQNKQRKPPIAQFNTLKEHLYYSTFTKGLSELLRYADRNSMAHSVEVRLPFLNHKLVEFIFSLPEDMLINNAWTKYILRYSMQEILPKEITWRKDKIGYEPPQNKWIENDFFKSEINDAKNRLLQNKLITKTYDKLDWKYLMLSSYL